MSAMALPTKLLEFSKEHKIKIFEQSHFEKDSTASFGSKDDHITTYVAYVSNDPTSRVMIKKFMRIVEGSLLALYSRQQALVEERMWVYFKRECRVWNLKGEDHPNIIKFYGIMKQAENQIPAFVTQLASHGNLYKFIARGRANFLQVSSKMKLMCDVADGLSFLHERGVVHRDLKASNIMLDQNSDGTLKALLGEFGTAKDFEDLQVVEVQNSTNMATLAYSSPEQLRTPHVVDGAKDMWSFGCVTLELFTCSIGVWPINYSRETIQSMLEDGEHPPRPADVSETNEVWIFIEKRCWCEEPEKRATASQASLELKRIQ